MSMRFTVNNLDENVTIAATRIFCQAPPVFPGDPAKVTCHFPEDLHHSKTSFGLFQRVSNGQNEGE